MVLHSTQYFAVCKGFKSHLHIFRLTPSSCHNFRHLAIRLRIYSSVALHDSRIGRLRGVFNLELCGWPWKPYGWPYMVMTLETIWLTTITQQWNNMSSFHYCVIIVNHMVSKAIIMYGQPYGFQGQPHGSRSKTPPIPPILLPHLSRPSLGPTQPATQRVLGLSRG